MKNNIGIITLLSLLWACVDEVTLKNQRATAEAIVIQGKLVKAATASVEATVLRVGDFENSDASTHISGAKVSLLAQDGARVELVEEILNRIYRAPIPANFPVKTGTAYRLQVQLPNGNRYESAAETLLAVPKMKQVRFRPFALKQSSNATNAVETLPYLAFQVSTPLQTTDSRENARLRWTFFATYKFSDNLKKLCYYNEALLNPQVFIYNGELLSAERLDTFSLAEIQLNHRLAEGFYVTVVQESLSENGYIYWDRVKQLSERSGNMFEAPAGKIITNITSMDNKIQPVYGYFYPTEQDTARLFISPAEVGNPSPYCPVVGMVTPSICYDCLAQITGVTLQKPHFWID
jgi:hypothetical protein